MSDIDPQVAQGLFDRHVSFKAPAASIAALALSRAV